MRILVLEEKHGTFFLNASTSPKLNRAALSVVKARLHPDWGYYYEEDPPESINITQEDIDKLPDGRGKETLKRQLEQYKKAFSHYERDRQDYEDAKRAVKTKDGKLAWQLLANRSNRGYEYEGVHLEEVKDEYGEEE